MESVISGGSQQLLLPRLFRNNVPGHTTRAPQVGFEPGTNSIQFYAIANLDKTLLHVCKCQCVLNANVYVSDGLSVSTEQGVLTVY